MKWVSIRRPSPSMVVALLALVIAASGTAIAAIKQVSGDSLIKKNSLSGNRLRNKTLTGTQINLSKLGKVPSATHADAATNATNATNAGNVDGQTIKGFGQTVAAGTMNQVAILSFNGLTLTLSCTPAGKPVVQATAAVTGSFMRGHTITAAGTSSVGTSQATAGSPNTVFSSTDQRGSLLLHYLQTDGHRVDVDAVVDDSNTINGFDGCLLEGTAIAG